MYNTRNYIHKYYFNVVFVFVHLTLQVQIISMSLMITINEVKRVIIILHFSSSYNCILL